ncbi:MAG: ferritin family protein, partial [bacterium]|nr:ferritin family protein [bacterium]
MPDNKLLDIIKKAILMEHRGRALYQDAAAKTDSEGVKELFTTLADEEDNHVEILNRQYKSIARGEGFDVKELPQVNDSDNAKVLSGKIVKDISGAGYEAAVIAAALEFEKKAVEFYSARAENAGTDAERVLFQWLTDWEKGHMTMLAQLDKELMEDIWYDN